MDEETRQTAARDIAANNVNVDALARQIGHAALQALRMPSPSWGDPDRAGDWGFPGRTNLDRALNGRDMAALALTGSSYMAYEDYETGLVDALANLMHFARRYEISFFTALASAEEHHDVERKYGWDEVPV